MTSLRDTCDTLFGRHLASVEARLKAQVRSFAPEGAMVAFYPDDWVVVRGPSSWGCTDHDDGRRTIHVESASSGLCPRSVWDDPAQRAEFLRTGKIPKDAPELRRIVSIKGLS